MFVLGLQGSPRRKGNTADLLERVLDEAEKLGARTHSVEVARKNIVPCREYIVCEKKGFCPIDDDMPSEIYPLLRRADVIIVASPVFFYNMTAQLKALVDRCQTLWARRYKLKLNDPGHRMRRGFLLAVGATQGKNLFEGIHLTTRYFLDAVSARYEGGLTYRGIEKPGDLRNHPTVAQDVSLAVEGLLKPFMSRPKLLFACRENACRSQMAGALAQTLAGDRFEVLTGGSSPAAEINPMMVAAMQEKGIDMAFRTPRSLEDSLAETRPDLMVTMGCDEVCPVVPGTERRDWPLPDPAGQDLETMRRVRDEIEERVRGLLAELT